MRAPSSRPRRQPLAADLERAGVQRLLAAEQLRERLLPVAGDAGHREHLAGAHVEVDRLQRPAHRRASQRADDRAGCARAAHDRRDLAPDHRFGEQRLVGARGRQVGDEPAATQHGDAVRDAQHLVELVADEDDREAVGDELAERREQRLALLRRQHRGRLVEDQDPRAAHQRLQDLDALALADRQRADTRVGIDLQAEALRGRHELRARLAAARHRPPERLRAEHHVVEHAEVVGQREVLVHHADARRERRLRLAGRQRGAEDLDRAGVGDVVAEQDRHQRALARAVLAEQREHLAARERQRDGVVRDERAEALGDAVEAKYGIAQERIGRRRAAPSRPAPLGGRRRRRLGAVISPSAWAARRRP